MRRKVVGLVEVPYDLFPDGKPKTYTAYELECGHTSPASGATGANRSLATSPVTLDRQTRDCKKCKED